MTAPSMQDIYQEIVNITNFLVEEGFVDDQNYPVRRQGKDTITRIDFDGALPLSSMLKEVTYVDLYAEQAAARSFNFRMLDGALVQMSYEFQRRKPLRSRLAFLPSPNLINFQSQPEEYLRSVLYAEVVNPQVVTVPVRFDFDARPDVATSVHHPQSHLTLGQYKNCRIALTAPMTPGVFLGFLLRSFYTTAIMQIAAGVPCLAHRFAHSITPEEAELPHLAIP